MLAVVSAVNSSTVGAAARSIAPERKVFRSSCWSVCSCLPSGPSNGTDIGGREPRRFRWDSLAGMVRSGSGLSVALMRTKTTRAGNHILELTASVYHGVYFAKPE